MTVWIYVDDTSKQVGDIGEPIRPLIVERVSMEQGQRCWPVRPQRARNQPTPIQVLEPWSYGGAHVSASARRARKIPGPTTRQGGSLVEGKSREIERATPRNGPRGCAGRGRRQDRSLDIINWIAAAKVRTARLLARHVDGIFLSDFEQGEIGPDLFRHAPA